jgi:hypothetical protein
MAYREHVSPAGLGYDIGCGNKAVCTDLRADDIRADVPALMDRISWQISFGMGRTNEEPVGHPVLDAIRTASFAPQRDLHDLAAAQLGTVGAGNHYVDRLAWPEQHDGQAFWVVRKGATPARPGQRGFVGSTMGERSVILGGVDSPRSAEALYSTVHGAGRAMSRTAAAGRRRRRSAGAGSSCAAAPPTRRPAPTSASTRSSPRTPAPSGCCTPSRRSASRWPAPRRSTPTRTDPSAARGHDRPDELLALRRLVHGVPGARQRSSELPPERPVARLTRRSPSTAERRSLRKRSSARARRPERGPR